MIKAVGIVGGSDANRATLVRGLTQELTGRGHQVAVLRHPSDDADDSPEEAASLAGTVGLSGFVSERGTVLYWPQPLTMEEIIRHIDADFLIADGFAEEKSFPRIVALDDGFDQDDLSLDLTLCTIASGDGPKDAAAPVLGLDDMARIADVVEKAAFKLPALDCKECGFKTCYEMAGAIVAGDRTVADCVSLSPQTVVTLDGQLMPMKSFVSDIIRGTIVGMLTSLKGFHKGVIEIRTE
ncbi:MAG: molybdopterin-guanine dinucleotide biosynthesis protein MobB [Candidatus Deferrimicrobiaceae bacterium]